MMAKTQGTQIRIERYRGKRTITQRRDGRVISRIPYTGPESRRAAIARFRQSGDINEAKYRTIISQENRIAEISVSIQEGAKKYRAPRLPRDSRLYQYYVKLQWRGFFIDGRSIRHPNGFPISEAREEAIDNALIRANAGGRTDRSLDIEAGRAQHQIIAERVIYYERF